mmetsp:Transcript_17414/g.25149  ORF Transcript_17414/g.25149 Transcript_17414/m.25149 type:complete len:177 (-) Transcript_17414:290-820(-)|eukprot:CAMPEP_0202458864 /NCGR_PEP_ID=MMETSP1360-20130828/28641_1 /ASSEMBLY_ACC=CAM_ASM_000848 /TAXON_ID=515479 /ORGANISM="Licmophora paradoxa, Strain CCMP2313" /LENGTH=176 /DNA_ID=CAMNT_0049079609 /DNA_START=217 /DNA_END=747 /DNA_ORIENTATION=+
MKEPEDLGEHLTKKYGFAAAQQLKNPNHRLMTMGKEVGIQFENNRKIYNTIKAHAVMEYIKSKEGNEMANKFMEVLYKNYFELAQSIDDHDKLIEWSKNVGSTLSDTELRDVMDNTSKQFYEVQQKDQMWKRQFRISGVPFYIIGGDENDEDAITFSGAYPADYIAEQLKLASQNA